MFATGYSELVHKSWRFVEVRDGELNLLNLKVRIPTTEPDRSHYSEISPSSITRICVSSYSAWARCRVQPVIPDHKIARLPIVTVLEPGLESELI